MRWWPIWVGLFRSFPSGWSVMAGGRGDPFSLRCPVDAFCYICLAWGLRSVRWQQSCECCSIGEAKECSEAKEVMAITHITVEFLLLSHPVKVITRSCPSDAVSCFSLPMACFVLLHCIVSTHWLPFCFLFHPLGQPWNFFRTRTGAGPTFGRLFVSNIWLRGPFHHAGMHSVGFGACEYVHIAKIW